KLSAGKYIVLTPATNDMNSLTGDQKPTITSNKIEYSGLNVSIPLDKYGTKGAADTSGKLTTASDEPFNKTTTDTELYSNGTISCYKTICLQRLADPTRAHHPVTNPYVTVDWNMIDLHVINTPEDATKEKEVDTTFTHKDPEKGTNGKLVSRQWVTGTTPTLNLWSRVVNTNTQEDFSFAPTYGTTADPLLHFPWHDAPFANSYELMLIPASTAGRFGVEFYDKGSGDLFGDSQSLGIGTTNKPRFSNPAYGIGLYLNFFHSANTGSLNLSRLFEYVRVPSKFGGTIRRDWITDASGIPIKPIYEMREPGKINLNTATEPAWEALQGSAARTEWHGYSDANGLLHLRESSVSNYPSEFVPFRSPQAVNLVPPLKSGVTGTLVQNPANTTLLRTDSGSNSLLESETDADNPYTLLESYMRLSDMTTTRSNVFAVWMTIGYFEVIPCVAGYDTNIYPDGYQLGLEKGLDNGTVKRHRAFYLIDRSTPVGFRRGTVYQQENGNPHYKPVIVDSKILE
ncbi:MAG: hypothetical protein LBK82_15555, partial [Planctomycetaceae bacterium]|nr:hypothetical protein [Planctomycetaceae bacterium]